MPSASANKRGQARLAAVQALYQMEISGTPLAQAIEEHKPILKEGREIDGEIYPPGDLEWFRGTVEGVAEKRDEIDRRIKEVLPESWAFARLDVLLRAVLRAGTFEIDSRRQVPARVAISEYVDVAKAFFESERTGMVNGVLDAIARSLRPDEMKARATEPQEPQAMPPPEPQAMSPQEPQATRPPEPEPKAEATGPSEPKAEPEAMEPQEPKPEAEATGLQEPKAKASAPETAPSAESASGEAEE